MVAPSERKSTASIAIYLTSHNAILSAKNRKGQTPLDLCSDPNLIKLLQKARKDQHRTVEGGNREEEGEGEGEGEGEESVEVCKVCKERRREVLFVPCGHVTSCVQCSADVQACQICSKEVAVRKKVHTPHTSHTHHLYITHTHM